MSVIDKFKEFRNKVNSTIGKYNTPENRARLAAAAERMETNFSDAPATKNAGKKAAKTITTNAPRFADPERLINLGSDWRGSGFGPSEPEFALSKRQQRYANKIGRTRGYKAAQKFEDEVFEYKREQKKKARSLGNFGPDFEWRGPK
jgi:hypothetical protein